MNKVAVFGKPGSGKSMLSKLLAEATGLPLYQLDLIAYQHNGQRVERDVFEQNHNDILAEDSWIIDGLGPLNTFNDRLTKADTLIYIDLPYRVSYWFVTKRLFRGIICTPDSWPKGCSVINGSLQSYRTLKRCPAFWNANFMRELNALSHGKTLHVIRSTKALNQFIVKCNKLSKV
ncbi:adenylate kinase [Thalassotalea sediminis]|uniref:adenylate kinase n=1 Tax=Thalassotalea sediminis TaxID=1759089 RepID=UPI00257482F4|nr:adenylate kinase [Thalassotalea sediminis]